ncbi:MAG: LiaF-related protein [Chloroflexota bacterium]|nr:LiaF-related protein [Chloroflexota bacterium]
MMTEEKKYKTEFSFSFDKLGQDVGEFVRGLSGSTEETVKQSEFSAPLDGATSAKVRIDFAVGENVVKALTNLDNLIEADIMHVGEVNFVVDGAADKTVVLSQRAKPADWARNLVGWIGSQGKLRWDVGLASQVPMTVDINGGVGESNIDLSEIQLRGGRVNGGTGEINVKLPATGMHYDMELNTGVGELDVTVAAGADVALSMRGGAGELKLIIGEGANVTADINGGVGECHVHIPEGTAARVEAKTGIGDVSVRMGFNRISAGDNDWISKSGVWETADYATAERKVTIHYQGGVGELKVT